MILVKLTENTKESADSKYRTNILLLLYINYYRMHPKIAVGADQ